MKKIITIIISIFILGMFVPYKYSNSDACNYISKYSNSKSRCMCAWYVMRAIHKGGCYPCGIYPAYAYKRILPKLGYTKISPNYLQAGDICVLSTNSRSNFGHIAIYNGQMWISDYKQKSLYPNSAYRNESECSYYRLSDGWHTANIWESPSKLFEYLEVLIYNYKRIKL